MKKYRNISALIAFLLLGLGSSAQDPNYSQFLNSPTYYNPAYCGLYKGFRARFSFRDQWPVLPYDFKAYYFSADLGAREIPGSGGFGVLINSDNEGIGYIRNLNVGLLFSARIKTTRNMLAQVGLKVAWYQKSLNWDEFVFSDEISEKYGIFRTSDFRPPDGNTVNMPDFGFGGIIQFVYNPTITAGTIGISVDHLFEPDQSFLKIKDAPLPRKYVAHGDLVLSLRSSSGFGTAGSGGLKLGPGILYQKQGNVNSIQAGMNASQYGVALGLWYKGSFGSYSNGALVFFGGYRYEFSKTFAARIGYSYDMQLTGALQGTGGAHEITMSVELGELVLFGSGPSGRIRRGNYDSRLECSEFN